MLLQTMRDTGHRPAIGIGRFVGHQAMGRVTQYSAGSDSSNFTSRHPLEQVTA
jgi:hypothetical protein